MTKTLLLVALAALLLQACAIRQTVKPAEHFDNVQVCVIDNPAVRASFLDSYKRALESKGYVVKLLPESASMVECEITSTYTANWQWAMAIYMNYAEIKVYRNGKPIGEAKYDARHGSGNMNKFIDADAKITELVGQLFPRGARP